MHAPKENCSKIKEPYDDPVGVEIDSVKFPAKIICNEEHSLPHPWLTHTDRNNWRRIATRQQDTGTNTNMAAVNMAFIFKQLLF